MCHADIVHEHKVEARLTRCAMADQMEFWNSDTKGVESGEIDWWNGWVGREAMLQVLSPLAGNIIGNDHIGNPHLNTIREGGCHGIVNVDVSKFHDQLNRIGRSKCITFPPSGGQ